MTPRRLSLVTTLAACAAASSPLLAQAPRGDAATQRALTAIVQHLLDAVAIGDTAVWNRHLAPDGLFVDENGDTRTKAELIATMKPLPPGYSGEIRVMNARLARAGTIALLTYDGLEAETIHGQTLHTRFRMADTFVRRRGTWLLFGEETEVIPSEHHAVTMDPTALPAYVGRYELAHGVGIRVTVHGDSLMAARDGQPPTRMLPLGVDRFFRVGAMRGERIFRRDAHGSVDAMIDRRDNNDLVWHRVP